MNLEIYKEFNKDLKNFNDDQLIEHFDIFGKNENRIFDINSLFNLNEHLIYFDLNYYKLNNNDLNFSNDVDWVLDYLRNRINDGRKISENLTDFKNKKFEKIEKILNIKKENNNYLSTELKNLYKIGINQTESGNGISEKLLSYVNENDLVLNVSAGYRKNTIEYFSLPNYINTEIFAYPTTDIVCSGDELPFKDNSFDVVFSLAVLEHVDNPFKHASELLRVTKPNGILIVDVPFLQPYHGYPYHYYNMTTFGLKNLFHKNIEIINHFIGDWEKPIYSLTWFLNEYRNGLDEKTKIMFDNLTVSNIINNGNNLSYDYVSKLDNKKEEILACGSTLIAKKCLQTVNEQTVNEQTVNEQTVNEQTVNEQTVNEQIVNEQTVNEQTVNEQTVNEQIVNEQTVNKQTVNEQIVNEQTVNEQTVNEQIVNEQIVNDQINN